MSRQSLRSWSHRDISIGRRKDLWSCGFVILHKLILHHIKHGPDEGFSVLQVEDAIAWMRRAGVSFRPGMSVLDLGCGSGVFGLALMRLGCNVTFVDEKNWLGPEVQPTCFRPLNIEKDNMEALGQYDLVVCSNVIEHIRDTRRFITGMRALLNEGGYFYLSWTNWFSPWGGHDFSPFHYLGPRLGPWLFDRLVRRKRLLIPYENLFPTHIGPILRLLKRCSGLQILRVAPRYYPELWPIMRIPIVREFLAWNCVVLLYNTPGTLRPV